MEVVTMEKKAFDLMMARYDALVKKVELLKHKANGKRLNKWLTGHEVCQQLRISQRTLQKPVSYTHLTLPTKLEV